AATPTSIRETQETLAKLSTELAASRADAAAARMELAGVQSQLTAARQASTSNTTSNSAASGGAAALERERTAQKVAGLQAELNDTKSRLTAAEKGSATRDQ